MPQARQRQAPALAHRLDRLRAAEHHRAAEAAAHRQQQEHGGKQRRLPERKAEEIQINAATPALLNLGRTTEAEQPGPK